MYLAAALLLIGVTLVILLAFVNWKWNVRKSAVAPSPRAAPAAPAAPPARYPRTSVQEYQADRRESIEKHLDALTRTLAEKEVNISLSKCQLEAAARSAGELPAAAAGGERARCAAALDTLRGDMRATEEDCRRLRERIEWVARRRAEVEDEMGRSQKLYSAATSELVSGLAQLQRRRSADPAPRARRPAPDVAW